MKPLPHRLVSAPKAIANSSKSLIAAHAEKPKSIGGVKDGATRLPSGVSGSYDKTVNIWDLATASACRRWAMLFRSGQ